MSDRRNHTALLFLTSPGIGDFINCLPAVRLLKKKVPGTRILALIKSDSRYRDLVGWVEELDETRIIDTKKDSLVNKLRFRRIGGNLSAFLLTLKRKPFGAALINYKLTYCLWAWIARIPVRSCYIKKWGVTHRADIGGIDHVHEWYRRLLEPLGAVGNGEELLKLAGLKAPDDVLKKGRKYLEERFDLSKKTVFVCFGGTLRYYHWGYENFAELTRLLAGRGRNVLIVTGPYETEALERHRDSLCALPSVRWEAGVDLTDLGGILAACDLFVGGSTGPLHLAHALGTPVAAIFARRDMNWRPLGPNAAVLCKNPPEGFDEAAMKPTDDGYVRSIPVERILAVCEKMLRRGAEPIPEPERIVYC